MRFPVRVRAKHHHHVDVALEANDRSSSERAHHLGRLAGLAAREERPQPADPALGDLALTRRQAKVCQWPVEGGIYRGRHGPLRPFISAVRRELAAVHGVPLLESPPDPLFTADGGAIEA